MRHVVVRFPKQGVQARARLLDDLAPTTCEAIWRHLPLRGTSLHDIWSGRQVFLPLQPPLRVEPENCSLYVVPGDLYYYERGPHLDRGRPYGYLELSEIGLVYGRDSQPWSPRGPKVVNIFATIGDNLEQFAAACEQMIWDGAQDLEILPG
ncbi:MAG: DUF3830 family protein [Armatimonadetes bacterium]|nr:DUF3830 family protein [Armatimonadota bacterium]